MRTESRYSEGRLPFYPFPHDGKVTGHDGWDDESDRSRDTSYESLAERVFREFLECERLRGD